jgi:hypothetical protein
MNLFHVTRNMPTLLSRFALFREGPLVTIPSIENSTKNWRIPGGEQR